jgi:hypothetical protein
MGASVFSSALVCLHSVCVCNALKALMCPLFGMQACMRSLVTRDAFSTCLKLPHKGKRVLCVPLKGLEPKKIVPKTNAGCNGHKTKQLAAAGRTCL